MKIGKPLIFISIAVTIVLVLYILYGKWSRNVVKTDRAYWSSELQIEKDRPYDISIFFRFIKTHNNPESFVVVKKQKELVQKLTLAKNNTEGIYFFAGNEYYLSGEETDSLLNYVNNGNTAFIATSNLPDKLSDILYQTGGTWVISEFETDSLVSKFKHSSLSSKQFIFKHPYKTKPNIKFRYKYAETSKNSAMYSDKLKYPYFAALTELEYDKTDFFRVPYGKGYFYIHLNPILFSNNYVSKDTGATYVDAVLAHLKYKNVIWDEASRFYKIDGLLNDQQKQSVFHYLLSKPSLKAAMIIFGISILAFMIFGTKRKQAVIPVLTQKQNTSIEYTRTIGNYYFLEHDVAKVTKQKMNLFLGFVRFHYRINTTLSNQVIIEAISQKSKMPLNMINEIFNTFELIDKKGALSHKKLATFDSLLSEFYNKTILKNGK